MRPVLWNPSGGGLIRTQAVRMCVIKDATGHRYATTPLAAMLRHHHSNRISRRKAFLPFGVALFLSALLRSVLTSVSNTAATSVSPLVYFPTVFLAPLGSSRSPQVFFLTYLVRAHPPTKTLIPSRCLDASFLLHPCQSASFSTVV